MSHVRKAKKAAAPKSTGIQGDFPESPESTDGYSLPEDTTPPARYHYDVLVNPTGAFLWACPDNEADEDDDSLALSADLEFAVHLAEQLPPFLDAYPPSRVTLSFRSDAAFGDLVLPLVAAFRGQQVRLRFSLHVGLLGDSSGEGFGWPRPRVRRTNLTFRREKAIAVSTESPSRPRREKAA